MFAFTASNHSPHPREVEAWSARITSGHLRPVSTLTGNNWACCVFRPPGAKKCVRDCLVERGHKVYLFDGKLDYRIELCAQLGVNTSNTLSDAELFARAYLKWGTSCVEQLYGDFALAVWDIRQCQFWAATDHCAEVKLFYARTASDIVVSTHLPGVREHAMVNDELDWKALTHTIIGVLPHEPERTAHKAIQFLNPGSVMRWQVHGRPRFSNWYTDPNNAPEHRRLRPGEIEGFVETFRAAVTTQLGGAQRVAALVSGGLDSTLVAGHAADLLRTSGGYLEGYTSVPHGRLPIQPRWGWDPDDWPYAQSLAKMHSNLNLQALTSGRECLLDLFARIHACVGSPVRNGANHAWLLESALRTHANGGEVILTGQRGNLGVSRACPLPAHATLLRCAEFGQLSTALGRVSQRRLKWQLERARTVFHSGSSRYESPPPRDWLAWSGLRDANSLADLRVSFEQAQTKSSRPCLSHVRINIAFMADTWAYCGVRLRDPTADRKVLHALDKLPAVAHFWRGLQRGIARRAGSGVVPEQIRRRESRGAQSPDEAALAKLYAESYRAAWAQARRLPAISEQFNTSILDHKFTRFIQGRATRYEAQYCHRVLDVAMFVRSRDRPSRSCNNGLNTQQIADKP